MIAFASKKLTGLERSWTATEGECFAVLFSVKKWHHFLAGREFTLITDHATLKYIMTASDTSHKWALWALKLQGYDFKVQHRPGKENTNANGLDRLQIGEVPPEKSAPLSALMMFGTSVAEEDEEEEGATADAQEEAQAPLKCGGCGRHSALPSARSCLLG